MNGLQRDERWEDVSVRDDLFMGYSTRGFRVVERVEGSDEPLPILEEDDILFYTLANTLQANDEIRRMRAVNVKFLQGSSTILSLNNGFMQGQDRLKRVCFGKFDSLKIVAHLFFSDCGSLVSISFKGLDKILAISDGMLSNCHSLTSINLKGLNSLKSLGGGFLHNCKSLKTISLVFPSCLRTIYGKMLSDCKSLTSASFEKSGAVLKIEGGSFTNCGSLKSVSFVGPVSFKPGMFLECTSLESVSFGVKS
jgi:hypothetical protein